MFLAARSRDSVAEAGPAGQPQPSRARPVGRSLRPAERGVTPASLLAALLLAATTAVAAQEAQLPSAREVIDRHIEAIGGREAIESHTSLHAEGILEVVGQGLVGEMELYAAAPDKMLLTVSFPAVGIENRTGYDGEVGWSIDPMTGERLLQGAELQQLVDDADYYADLHEPSKFRSMETIEQVEFDGRQAYKVALVYEESGREVFEYFEVESGRLIGGEGVQVSIMGSMNVIMVLREYQQFDDLMAPTLMEQDVGGLQTIRITIQTIELDNVDPAVFDLPPAIQALIRRP